MKNIGFKNRGPLLRSPAMWGPHTVKFHLH
jgi:hypothetical protein